MNSLSNLSATFAQPKPFSAPKFFSAKHFVETKNMSQAEWLEIHRKGIASSDCSAACGLNPYMSMLELWMIKTGRIQQNIGDEREGHAPLYWGKQLEPLVAEYYRMYTNYKVRRVNAVLQHPEPDKHFMLLIWIILWLAMPMYKYWSVKRQASMVPSCGEMVYRYMCSVRYSINWQ